MAALVLLACSTLHADSPGGGLAANSSAFKASHFVATDGDDTNPGTEQQPFRTIEQAISAVRPGDTVALRAGRYPGFLLKDLHGAADRPITFRAFPNEKVIIDRHLGGPNGVIQITGCSYLVLAGLELVNSSPAVDAVRRLDLHKKEDLATYLEKYQKSEAGRNRNGIHFLTGRPPRPPFSHHLIFRELEIHHLMGVGIAGRADDTSFLDNHVYDVSYGWYTNGKRHLYRGNRVHDAIYGFHLWGSDRLSYTKSLSDSIIENNVIYATGGTYYHGYAKRLHKDEGVGLLLTNPGSNNIIRNNVVYGNRFNGIVVKCRGTLVANNTVYGNGRAGLRIVRGQRDERVHNNILFRNKRDLHDEGDNTRTSHNLMEDPQFVDAAAGDFHLREGSPAIDRGLGMTKVPEDMKGTARPQGAGFDIGAYEFGSAGVLPEGAKSPDPATEAIESAIRKSIPLLEKGSAGSAEQRKCFTCHNQGVPVFALVEARRRGFTIDEDNLQRQLKHTAAHLNRRKANFLKGGGKVIIDAYALWTLESGGWQPDETTAAAASFLLVNQKNANHWSNPGNRPPSVGSDFTTTYVALRGLATFGTEEQQPKIEARNKTVRQWLLSETPGDTEDRVFRLRALRYVDADDETVRRATAELLDAQRDDGGWAQTSDMKSDAYATGTVLVALMRAGDVPADHPAVRRGVQYLVGTQLEDGAWHVVSRAKPFQTYFESGFPHGKDQFISIAGSGWATLAMLLALPEDERAERK